MDINDILDSLGLDLTNPEVKRGAAEAINAILASRQPGMMTGPGGTNSIDIEVDPDLIMPSTKQARSSQDTFDIDDEEELLKQVKHNKSNNVTADTVGDEQDDSGDSSGSADNNSNDESNNNTSNSSEQSQNSNSGGTATEADDDMDGLDDDDEFEDDQDSTWDADDQADEDDQQQDGGVSSEPLDAADDGASDDAGADKATSSGETDEGTREEDALDDTLKDVFTDKELKTKHDARKIKRERTILAAKQALASAKAKKAAPALIRELEKALTALEELTEAVNRSINDLSDEEFNMIVNRVFDAIDAIGNSGLTYSSEEERKLQAQEIKADLSSSQTQQELSAEDIALIRAEHQAVKARDAEANKYKKRARSSFKGFQDFLGSLYRAIALQVHTEETQDDSWSAINRRHSGSGVLQPGKKIQELPNKKIPVIDFYFDCSGSWNQSDIAVGKKAVEALADMEDNGQIKINLYYFGDEVSSEYDDVVGGGTSGWNEIVKNVISSGATNVIIMTDDDMENWWEPDNAPPLKYIVPGYVWYLWRDGMNAPRLPRDLKGRGGTQQFTFSRGDL